MALNKTFWLINTLEISFLHLRHRIALFWNKNLFNENTWSQWTRQYDHKSLFVEQEHCCFKTTLIPTHIKSFQFLNSTSFHFKAGQKWSFSSTLHWCSWVVVDIENQTLWVAGKVYSAFYFYLPQSVKASLFSLRFGKRPKKLMVRSGKPTESTLLWLW